MIVWEFRYITKNDIFDNTFPHWSRKYEYPTVMNYLFEIYDNKESPIKVHNTSMGFDVDHHIRFKNMLESYFGERNVVSSDLQPRYLPNTCVYDITSYPDATFHEAFDCVLNISALEEIPGDHGQHLLNLYANLKVGGYLIITFDLPGFQLERVEEFLGKKMATDEYDSRIIGHGGPWFDGLNVGLLIIQKD